MIEKEFVTYKIAKKLKEIGFEEECLAWYNYKQFELFGQDLLLDNYAGEENRPLAPLWQQAETFFRNRGYEFGIGKIYPGSDWYHYHVDYTWRFFQGTYEETREEMIKELIKLTTEGQ